MTKSATKGTKSLADCFFKNARDTEMPVSLYLVNGYQLKGDIIEFDEAAILFKQRDTYQIVMRTAVASMYPVPKSKGYVETWWSNYRSLSEEE